ncbi:AzlD domain-containing protein [Pectobacteriaceae bacterium CE70]|uniref:Branched-chain amino acid transporter n=1 Tax=Serratia sp. (strain ATCC 39006) TaxID=104623 RepID=A0A2I5TCD5_SERS3|nr:AzlD domain-containing protein [Serratia sp. ATCC 39006]WJV63152.1 AzlD domain-containing protein [Pectobacteriaceae bacterium C52]WJV67522.1 AzlD domain-containing protein [Pectobacteriaceae bacterium CE70]WJY11461.1 AzlD domain-containing protein [Pectobacteriaceae bacterium C80]AUH02238.1 branched-chain amino acid transporter [Serratia sp. ATCC 39006]AUH06559.1 branched-chain amino acid transporter [Serratia sp. ATCC 39006]
MSWALLLTLAVIVFVNRYVFLDPNVPVRMPQIFHDALQYSAPCRLTGICSPIILMKNNVVRVFSDNPYLWEAICAVVIAFFVRQMVASVLTSLPVFYILVYAL